jgi:predicted alpha-1,2-mannosidase
MLRRLSLIATVVVSAVALLGSTLAEPQQADGASGSAAPPTADLTTLVNPLAGSLGPGFVTVGAGVPFGMVTPGPATMARDGDDPINYVGYSYRDSKIRGFALTHFSGAGIHIGGELPMMPTTGGVHSSSPRAFASPFSHATEVAQPGYYAATLGRYDTRTELTATTRAAVERYTFPARSRGNVLFDVSRNAEGGQQKASLRFVDRRTLAGSVVIHDRRGITVWFTARFDRPYAKHGTWLGSSLHSGSRPVYGRGAGGWVSFDTSKHRVVRARIGISYVDAAGATRNLDREAPPSLSFHAARQHAHGVWNQHLHRIDVSGGSLAQRETFYTCLYHALLMPTTFDDADGRYLGVDDRVHQVASGSHHYTDLSLWDTYRTQTPLLTLIEPKVAHDVGISLLDDADQDGGVVPKWVRGNIDYGIMGGDSGTPTLATLVTNGALTGRSARRAYDAIVHQANTPTGPRGDLGVYLRKGYIPYDVNDRGASYTLEYAVDDAAVAALAHRFGTSQQVTTFTGRAGSWRNLLYRGDHFLRPRMSNGSWANPTARGSSHVWDPVYSDGWQEGTGWQYFWLVPQDVAGLRDLVGADVMHQRLDEFFGMPTQSDAEPPTHPVQRDRNRFGVYRVSNQFTPANETDLQAPWLYDWLSDPASTAQAVHADASAFNATPAGIPGNDDAGTLSANYVLSAMGLYQAQPGIPAWELSTPLYPSSVLHGDGAQPALTISAPGAGPQGEYVASASIGGQPLNRTWLTTAEVNGGKTLAYATSSNPTDWATGPQSAPPSLSGG